MNNKFNDFSDITSRVPVYTFFSGASAFSSFLSLFPPNKAQMRNDFLLLVPLTLTYGKWDGPSIFRVLPDDI